MTWTSEQKAASHKKWADKNRERLREYNKQYAEKNKDRIRDYRKQYEHAPERKAKRAERMRLWREQNAELSRERVANARAKNPAGILKLNRAYRARSWKATGTATPEQIEMRALLYGNRCAYCGGAYECVDHVIPLSRGGSNWPANLRPACRACNSGKRNRSLADYVDYRRRTGRSVVGLPGCIGPQLRAA